MKLIPAPGMIQLFKLRQFHSSQFHSGYSVSTNTVWKVPAMDWFPIQESQYNCSIILHGMTLRTHTKMQ